MRRLAIDCATQALSIALFDGDVLLDDEYRLIGRGHAEALVPAIGEMLGADRVDAIVVDVGPGSFTGIRVGVAAARALGFAWGVPVNGFGCLPLCAAMAQSGGAGKDGLPISIVMTGGHGELFWQRFDPISLQSLAPLRSTPVAQLAAELPDAQVHGSGAAALVEARGWGEAMEGLPDARCYALLPEGHRLLPPAPLYGRDADAKPMAVADKSL